MRVRSPYKSDARMALLVGLVLTCAVRPACALDPRARLRDLVHTAFTGVDLPFTSVRCLAQTKDGYLWLATLEGVYRFDGVRFTRFEPLSKTRARQLLATSDGGLWAVFDTGRVARLVDGKVITYPIEELPRTNSLAEDPDSSIMAAGSGLFRFRNGRWQEAARALHQSAKLWAAVWFDRDGALWLVIEDRLLKLPHGADRFVDAGIPAKVRRARSSVFSQSADGSVWLADEDAIHVAGHQETSTELRVAASAISIDRDGSFWMGNPNHGLSRIASAPAAPKNLFQDEQSIERFTRTDGLSGDQVQCVFEDREGNIWIGTDQGLDRFREGAFHRVPLPDPGRTDSLADLKSGGVVMIVRDQPWLRTVGTDGKTSTIQIGLPASQVCTDPEGTIWVVTSRGFGRIRGQVVSYPAQPELKAIRQIGCFSGTIFVADSLQGVFRYSSGKTEKIAGLRPQTLGFLEERPGRVWIPYADGTISVYDNGSLRKYGSADGLTGSVFGMHKAANGDIWLAGENALTRFRNGRFGSVDVTPGLPVWSVSSGDGNFLWLRAGRTVVRMDVREFDRALAHPDYKPQIESYGTREGLPDAAALAMRSGDRIWVVTQNGFGYLDVNPRLRKNQFPPPVQIETVTADTRLFAPAQSLRLPRLTHDLQIDYTALSLTYPEKVRFRYKLEGRDQDWQDVGTRRRAYYTDLAPKQYRFRVTAANNDGVWNEKGVALGFAIDPAWYQTRWFLGCCVAALLAMVRTLYVYRLHHMAQHFNDRLEERVTERTRIARELHDTLLQSFQGLMLHLQVVDDLLPEGKAKLHLDKTLQRADQAIAEARIAVYDLRSSTTLTNDLAHAMKSLGDELTTTDSAAFHVVVEGAPKDLHPIVRDEIYRIAREALRNAFNHAQAQHIETEITYGERTLRLRIRDDGKGIPSDLLAEGRRGHYGLCGMRERAKQVDGKLDIWSGPQAGTEIELTIASSIAYRSPVGRTRFGIFRSKLPGETGHIEQVDQ